MMWIIDKYNILADAEVYKYNYSNNVTPTSKPSRNDRIPFKNAGNSPVIFLVLRMSMTGAAFLPSSETSARGPPIS